MIDDDGALVTVLGVGESVLDNPVKVGEEELRKELTALTQTPFFALFDATLHGDIHRKIYNKCMRKTEKLMSNNQRKITCRVLRHL